MQESHMKDQTYKEQAHGHEQGQHLKWTYV